MFLKPNLKLSKKRLIIFFWDHFSTLFFCWCLHLYFDGTFAIVFSSTYKTAIYFLPPLIVIIIITFPPPPSFTFLSIQQQREPEKAARITRKKTSLSSRHFARGQAYPHAYPHREVKILRYFFVINGQVSELNIEIDEKRELFVPLFIYASFLLRLYFRLFNSFSISLSDNVYNIIFITDDINQRRLRLAALSLLYFLLIFNVIKV